MADDHTPTWGEACECYGKLHQMGPTADAFSFKQLFDPEGQPVALNRETVKRLAAQFRGVL